MSARKFMSAREGYVEDLSPSEQRALASRSRRVERQVAGRRRKATAKSFVEENAVPLGLLAAACVVIVVKKHLDSKKPPTVSGYPHAPTLARALGL